MTLRRAVLALLLIGFGAALAFGVVNGRCPGWVATPLWLAALIVAFIFERQRYTPAIAPGGEWNLTGERFIDPVTGERLAVFVNPQTGERDYRPLA